MVGYRHELYANSLKEFGTPRHLPVCDGWILEQSIRDSDRRDAMNCYPLFACRDCHQLAADMEALSNDLVSLTIVTDPFLACGEEDLRRQFNTMVIPFKEHFVLDLQRPIAETTSKRHRKKARSALKSLDVEIIEDAVSFLDEWHNLYSHLIERHSIVGVRAFSRESFAKQLAIPGTVVARVSHEGITVSAQVILFQDDVAHCHLAAFSPLGYEMNAGYAMDFCSIEYCASRARWYNLGGGVGTNSGGEQDGLSWYKSGWSSETRTSYLCGHIFDHDAYEAIVARRGIPPTAYFPAYRVGEFG